MLCEGIYSSCFSDGLEPPLDAAGNSIFFDVKKNPKQMIVNLGNKAVMHK